MTAGTTGMPPGQEMTPGRRWWRRARFLPLVILGILVIVALVVGRITSAELASRAAEIALPSPAATSSDAVASSCRPPVAPAAQEPWITDRAAAEATWQQHSAETAERYVIGPNGWIFWSEYVDQYASQAVGRDLLTATQVQQWIDHFTAVRDAMAARGIEFYVMVTPSTSSIYPEELPLWMQALRGSTIMDQVIGASGDLPIIDLRADLVAQKDGPAHLFSWSNSHWTEYGAYVAWKQIATCVNAMNPDSPPLKIPAISGATVVGDFNEWAPFGVKSPGADWAVPDFTDPLMDVTRTDKTGVTETVPGTSVTDLSILPAETTVPASWTGKSALIFRDSMGGGLSPLWQQAYSPTWQVNEPYITGTTQMSNYAQAVEEHHPDVVIVQLAERYLLNPPPQASGY
ncbi:alginate O-acetyltransferase AlgX-related protein [Microbacterium rhizomatis]|uniref:AlgX/AlgJ SGNH hydrolase-like domain-containing protein n=1 Tax=Microbacterium rhizomatis TaxID=1631477 RepID=A0A5J5J8A5_9MICO|nr:hypothetical protein [Microbacterium rhizomatis]KAA9111245.1 hypothetical protein F6B43_06530 [Microbacterium rhizomatis]